MKKIYTICALAIFCFASCKIKAIALKGEYPNQPMAISTDKSFEQVWSNLIDLFAQKGLSIKVIDKSSGLIVSERTAIPVSIEDKKGRLKDPQAYLAVPKIYVYNLEKPINYRGGEVNAVTAEWNVRIKATGNGSVVNVNLVNPSYTYQGSKSSKTELIVGAKSTGIFENYIADQIK